MSIENNTVLAGDKNLEKLDAVCRQSWISELVDKLHKKYDTQVGKWFDDERFEPSGGEGQRIAIARACYRDRKIFLLDEPTAALDPMAEYEIYTQFGSMITDKCAVLITHRLSAVYSLYIMYKYIGEPIITIFKTANCNDRYHDSQSKENVIDYIFNMNKMPHNYRGYYGVDFRIRKRA